MPLYEYECERCQKVFEVMQKFSDEPLSVHEDCGGALHRLISAPALQFKGSGWYITDYAKGKSPTSNGGSKSSDSPKSESKPAASKSDSKPAATSDSK